MLTAWLPITEVCGLVDLTVGQKLVSVFVPSDGRHNILVGLIP